MASYIDISSITNYTNGTEQFRLNPTGYELLVQQKSGASWVKVGGWKSNPLGNTNTFRFVIVSGELQLRQLISGGSFDGVEGTDYNILEYFNYV